MPEFKALVDEIDLENHKITVVSSIGEELEVDDFASECRSFHDNSRGE